MNTGAEIDFHRRHGSMSEPGRHAALFASLPRDLAAVARVIQGLLLHEHWAPAYGETLSDTRRGESQLRSVPAMLDLLLAHDPRPLADERPTAKRLVGVCRHFSLLMVSILRAQGIPARARCGFGAYFTPNPEDHWVAEYWDGDQKRWILVDAQVDQVQRANLSRIDFDLLDVPHDRFLIAGDAWQRCRTGLGEPQRFGIFDMRGLWFIAANVVRDFASLNHIEMLPWDVWGGMTGPEREMDEADLACIDEIAALTLDADAHLAEIRHRYAHDERLRVPPTVFNAVRQRLDTVEVDA